VAFSGTVYQTKETLSGAEHLRPIIAFAGLPTENNP